MSKAKKTSFVGEFKEFLIRGSVIDLAIGIIIGGAFSRIVNSLVADILTPVISFLTGGASMADWNIVLREGVTLNYGLFIQAVIDFVLIAFLIFWLVKMVNRLRRKQEEAAPPPAPSKEETLLAEIRDLLKTKQS
jgi:large conductance mechanosensitive channel